MKGLKNVCAVKLQEVAIQCDVMLSVFSPQPVLSTSLNYVLHDQNAFNQSPWKLTVRAVDRLRSRVHTKHVKLILYACFKIAFITQAQQTSRQSITVCTGNSCLMFALGKSTTKMSAFRMCYYFVCMRKTKL